MRWPILFGIVASTSGAAHAACDDIEMVTHGDPPEVSCHTGPAPSLPWVDWGTPRWGTIPRRLKTSVVGYEAADIEALGAQDISDLTRFDPWYDIPELDGRE